MTTIAPSTYTNQRNQGKHLKTTRLDNFLIPSVFLLLYHTIAALIKSSKLAILYSYSSFGLIYTCATDTRIRYLCGFCVKISKFHNHTPLVV